MRRPQTGNGGESGREPRDPLVLGVFSAGLALSVLGLLRNEPVGDQLMLLARGWKLANEGVWIALGLPTSDGGYMPGGLTGLLVGLPLKIWPDPIAPAALLLATHVIAYFLLDRLAREILGPRARRVFAIVYWLNPWRVYSSAFLWTPNYLFFLSAAHLWTIYLQRREPRFWATFFHVLVLGAALQIHLAAFLLVVSSLVLWWRGYYRPHLAAAGLAAAVVLASLVPWLALVVEDSSLLPLAADSAERGLLRAHSALRGWVYWLRFPTPAVSQTMACFDLPGLLGTERAAAAGPPLKGLLTVVGVLALLSSFWFHLRLWRRARRRWIFRGFEKVRASSGRTWLRGVAGWSLLTAIGVFILSPTTIMSWQAFPLFHLSTLWFSAVAGLLLTGRRRRRLMPWAVAYGVLMALVSVATIVASPPYRLGEDRCGSRSVTAPPPDHPVFY